MKRVLVLVFSFCSFITLWGQTGDLSSFDFDNVRDKASSLNKQARNISEDKPAEKLSLSLQAYEISLQENFLKGQVEALASMGVAYFHLQEPDKSLEALLQSYELANRYNFQDMRFYSSFHLGAVYKFLDEKENALRYLDICLDMTSDEVSERRFLAVIDKVELLRDESRFEETLVLLEESIKVITDDVHADLLSRFLLLRGEISFLAGEFRQAIAELLPLVDEKTIQNDVMNLLSLCYVQLQDFTTALTYSQESLLRSVELGDTEGRISSYKVLSQVYEKMMDYEKAFEFLQSYYTLKTRLEDEESVKNLNSIKAYYGSIEQEKEIGQQQQRIDNLKSLVIAGSIILFLLIVLLSVFFFLYKKNSAIAEKLTRDLKREMILSKTDPMTGLPNRRDFEEKIKPLKNCSLIFMSFEEYKKIDKEKGDGAGEELQKFVGKRIKSLIKGNDILAVWKPFVFSIALPETDRNGLETVKKNISQHFDNTPFDKGDYSLTLQYKIGSSTFQGEGTINNSIDNCKRQLRDSNT